MRAERVRGTASVNGTAATTRRGCARSRTSRPPGIDEMSTSLPGDGASRPTPGSNDSAGMDEMEFLKSVDGGHPPQTASDGTPTPNTIELETEGAPDLGESMLNRLNQRAKSG